METIFNFFPICNDKVISDIGFTVYEYDGSDDHKVNYLKEKAYVDFDNAKFYQIPSSFRITYDDKEFVGISLESYNTLIHNGTISVLFEPVFVKYNATKTPLFVITMIVDGKLTIEGHGTLKPETITPFTFSLHEQLPLDYLSTYIDEKGFHMDKLIADDFLNAINLLFNNGHYVSSLKLLMSMIDTISFIENGDIPGNFKMWLSKYCLLNTINVDENELWELRNSLLHMTNANSRKVLNKTVMPLYFYVNKEDFKDRISDGYAKYFNLVTLMKIIVDGLEAWVNSYHTERDKFKIFTNRYDLIISDSRFGKILY